MMLLAPLLALAAAAQQPRDFASDEEDERLQFSYSWPAAADGVPALRAMLQREMEAARTRARGYAEEGAREAAANGREPMQHHYVKGWQVAGQTPPLLSLSASEEAFAGGAHGNVAFAAILWDMEAAAPVQASTLLGAEALARMAPRFCAAVDAEREAIRGEPVRRDPNDPHTACPNLAEQVLVPQDEDVNGRFERLQVLIPPYVAGPYAEGAYVVHVPFTPRDLSGVPARYRAAFEAAPSATAESASTEDVGAACAELLREEGSACTSRVTDLYSFAVGWPGRAAAIPALEALLHEEAERNEQWMRQQSEEATAEREAAGAEPMRFTYQESWSVDADRPELVAASSSAQAYTGGAHGGIAYRVILLDRRAGRRLALGDLFADPHVGLAAVQASFCPALQRDVRARRSEQDQVECPAAAEHPVTLVGGEDGRIGAMMALLNPYVVGSWSEGPYEVLFPVTPQLLAALKPEYRAAFAVASQ